MTRETTRRGFVTGAVGAGAARVATTPAAAQETGTDGGATPSGGGTATGDGTATGGGTAGGGTAAGDGTAGGGTAGGGGGGQPDFGTFFEDVDNYDGSVADLRGEGEPEVQVGTEANGGFFGFGPAAVHVENGATVTWTWTGRGCPHNVVADEGAFDSGEAGCEEVSPFEFTFEEDGIYRYHCAPHLQLGMKGAVVVGTDYPTADTGGGGGGPGIPTVPDTALTLGVAAGFAMAATLGLTYLFIKYGGDYGEFDEA
jgi:halocyanin-like protein